MISIAIFAKKKSNQKKNYFVIDLRIIDEKLINNKLYNELFSGILPNTMKIINEKLLNENFPANIISDFQNEKNKYHFIILTSDTSLFNEYENQFYILEKLKNSRGKFFTKDIKN